MKIRITLKDPDGVYESVKDAIDAMPRPDGLTKTEWDDLKERRRDSVNLKPWIEYGEYCVVEIDTEAKTATVIPTA